MEVSTSINRQSLPQDLSQYDHIEHGRDTQERVVIYGVSTEGLKERIKEDDLIKSYGHDPAEWDKAKDDWEAWIAGNRVAYLENRNLPFTSSDELLENRRLKAQLGAKNEEVSALQAQLSLLQGEMAEMRNRLDRLENGPGGRLEDNRSWRDRASDWWTGRRVFSEVITRAPLDSGHTVRETVTVERHGEPRRGLVPGIIAVGAVAVGAYLLGRYTGSIDGFTDEQAQTIIDQNTEIIENQAEIVADQEEIQNNQQTIIDNQESYASDMESQHRESSAEHNGLNEDLQQHTNKNTQDHRELHGDIHPDASGGEASAESGPNAESPSTEGNSLGEAGGNQTQGDSRRESLEFGGNTIWSDVEKNLRAEVGYSPSDAQIHKATSHVLRINNLTWDQARHLPIGYSYKMPDNLSSVLN